MLSTWLEKVARGTLSSRLASLPHLQDAKPPSPFPNLLFSPASLAPGFWHGCQPAAAQIQAWRRWALLSWVCVCYPAHLHGEDLGENPDVQRRAEQALIPAPGVAGGAPAPNRSRLNSDSFSLHR